MLSIIIGFLISRESFYPLLSSGGRDVLDESLRELSDGDGHDIDVVTGDDEISGGNWERNLCEGGVWVVRQDTNMVTALVADTRTLNVEFNVNTVPFCADIEEFASGVDGSWEGVSDHP